MECSALTCNRSPEAKKQYQGRETVGVNNPGDLQLGGRELLADCQPALENSEWS